jgi:hypothetical protein
MQNKKIILSSVLVIVVLGLVGVFAYHVLKSSDDNRVVQVIPPVVSFDPANTTYTIDGQSVTLVNGKASVSAVPGSATQVTTSLFGKPTMGDLNHNSTTDAAVILVQNPGGSGTFYYVAAAIATASGTEGTNAILLGDRIAPQTLEIQNGTIIANYADRKPGQPMSKQPSVGVSKYFMFNGSELVASAPVANQGQACGGNMTIAPVCITGYHCAPRPGSHLPFGDVGGVCVAN